MKRTRKQRGKGLLFANGGSCTAGTCSIPQAGGNRTQRGKGCDSCGAKRPMMSLPSGIAPSQELLQGGSDCECGVTTGKSPWKNLTGGRRVNERTIGGIRTNGCGCTRFTVPIQQGGTCACEIPSKLPVALGGAKVKKVTKGGYRPTKRNLKYLKRWKQGRSIGFTMRSSLKAKGLIPRADGTYKVSPKYQHQK